MSRGLVFVRRLERQFPFVKTVERSAVGELDSQLVVLLKQLALGLACLCFAQNLRRFHVLSDPVVQIA